MKGNAAPALVNTLGGLLTCFCGNEAAEVGRS